jgi:hypothetical protein
MRPALSAQKVFCPTLKSFSMFPNCHVFAKLFFFDFVDSSGAICYLGVSSQRILRLVRFIISSKKE